VRGGKIGVVDRRWFPALACDPEKPGHDFLEKSFGGMASLTHLSAAIACESPVVLLEIVLAVTAIWMTRTNNHRADEAVAHG
jgi:hypothetical protein